METMKKAMSGGLLNVSKHKTKEEKYEIPEEWLPEMVPEQSEPILSEFGEELPF